MPLLITCGFTSIIDFFKELPQFVIKAGPIVSGIYGANWESRLEVLIVMYGKAFLRVRSWTDDFFFPCIDLP